MSNKGENKKAKAVSAPKAVHISRKEHKWTIRTKAGPHNKQTSIALGLILRNFAQLARTMKEAKTILNHGEIKVNGVVRTDRQFPVGLFDAISIEKQKLFYRIMLDDKERLVLKNMEKESKEKVSKIVNKVMTTIGVQTTTNDGRTFLDLKANIGDSVKLALPEGKVEEVLEFKSGAVAYITKGAHCSKIAVIKEIISGTSRRAKLVKLIEGKQEFETVAGNVFVIGKNKPALGDIQ